MKNLYANLAQVLAASFLILAATVAPLSAQPRLTASQWQQDLHYLVDQIQAVHPDAFHKISQAQFLAASARLDSDIPSLSDHQIEVGLAELVATLGEGHSRLSLPGLPDPMSDVPDITPYKDAALAFHRLPVRMYLFSDGLFVVAATPQYKALIGSQVLRIGGLSAQSALDAVQPSINRDNEMGAQLIGPDFVAIPEILNALHIIPNESSVPLVFRTPDGNTTKMDMRPLGIDEPDSWIYADDAAHRANSPYTGHARENLWTEYNDSTDTLFVRINTIQDSPDLSVAKFASQIESLAASHAVKHFIIDFRGCHGGDNQKFRAILLTLLRSGKIDRPGKFFVLIDRATFSAAVNAVSDLERLSNAIFVGEPTAGAPNSWGDPRKIILPNSGLIARIASVYWRDWTSNIARPWLAPDISVPVSSADYFAGSDPIVTTVLNFPPQTGFSDVLTNLVRSGAKVPTIMRLYYQHKTDSIWADETTENAMQRVGEEFIARKSYDDAFLVFAINFKDYPGSLPMALQSVQAALTPNPNDEGIKKLAEKLRALKNPS